MTDSAELLALDKAVNVTYIKALRNLEKDKLTDEDITLYVSARSFYLKGISTSLSEEYYGPAKLSLATTSTKLEFVASKIGSWDKMSGEDLEYLYSEIIQAKNMLKSLATTGKVTGMLDGINEYQKKVLSVIIERTKPKS